jgi:hypothetical protein
MNVNTFDYYLFYTKLIFIILHKIKSTNQIYVGYVLRLQGSKRSVQLLCLIFCMYFNKSLKGTPTCIVFIPLLINIAFHVVKLHSINSSHKIGKAFQYFVQAYQDIAFRNVM